MRSQVGIVGAGPAGLLLGPPAPGGDRVGHTREALTLRSQQRSAPPLMRQVECAQMGPSAVTARQGTWLTRRC